jgi:tetratricopeptide (TPR) repeat protein
MALLDELAKSNTRLRRTPTPEREELYTITNGNPLLLRWLTGQLGRPASHCRTIPQARAFLEAAPKGNDPLEYIFGDLLDTFTEDETRVLAALVHFDQSAELKWVAEVAELAEMAALTALEDLADRSLLVADEVRQQFFLPPLAATFLRRKRPEAVTQTGGRLTDHVYALALANGYNEYDRFPNLEAAWPTIAAALPLFVQTNSDKDRLQNVYAALRKFLDFSGRWDEWLALNQQAEERALAVGDFYNAGWRAYNAGTVHHRRGLALEVLACADRCAIYWEKTQQAGAREKAMVMCLLGRRYGLEKNYLAAIGVFREVLALQRTIEPESIDVGVILNDLAAAEQKQGEYSAAERHYYEGLHIAKKLNDDDGIVTCTSNLASLALESQDWATAKALVLEVLPLAEKLDKQETIGHLCWRLAEALVRQGRSQEGLPYVHRAVAIFTRLRKLESLEAAQTVLQECLMK